MVKLISLYISSARSMEVKSWAFSEEFDTNESYRFPALFRAGANISGANNPTYRRYHDIGAKTTACLPAPYVS